MKDSGVKEKLYQAAEKWDLWGYGGFGLPRMELEGDRYFLIEQHDGILEYGPNLIKVSAEEMVITICGMDMEIASMDKGSLAVRGRIASIEFKR
ncbi:MAG: YabP/YqfC family sporulation protein [Clostridiaceae bacterium]|nr:YabP/YqfC family sporulation protein [Clostridiaceae bacterium]